MNKSIPITEMEGPAGRIIVNTHEVDNYRKKGFKEVVESTKAEPETKPKPSEAEMEENTIVELRRLATDAGHKDVNDKTKEELIDLLEE